MRLTAAGEAFIRWVRSQASDLERVQSQIEDLAGMRRGLVRLACSQALAAYLLPHRTFAGRQIFDDRIAEVSARFDVRVEATSFEFLRNYVAQTEATTLQIELGAMAEMLEERLAARPIDDRDSTHGSLVLGQLRGRPSGCGGKVRRAALPAPG